MTDFDSLLPPRTAPPRLPSRGGPAVIMEAARARRRKKATKVVGTGGALSIVFLGVAVLRGPAPLHTIEEGPATTPPSVSASATYSASPSPETTLGPAPASPGDEPSGRNGGQGGPGAAPGPSGSPAPGTPPASLLPTGPAPSHDPSPAVRYVRVVREDVADRPAEDCLFHTSAENPDDVLCTRQFGPVQVPSGTPVDFGYEICAKTNDVVLHTQRQEEYYYRIMTDTTPGGVAVWTARERPAGIGAHDFLVKAGSCVRYTFKWDGRGDNGRPLPLGDYHVEADIPGDWTVQQGATDTTVRFRVT